MASSAPRHPALPVPLDPDALWIVDLSGYIFRAYHALVPLSSPSGEPTHAVHGTFAMLQRLLDAFAPANLVVCMDSKSPSFRKEWLPSYKANRPPAPPDLSAQIGRCEQIARAFGWCVLQKEAVEADDLIATATRWALLEGMRVVVVSGDKDLLQLVRSGDDRVLLFDPSKDRVVDAAGVREKFGVPPEALGDWLALVGDASDNVPGVTGVGPKTATDLLLNHLNLRGIMEAAPDLKKEKLRQSLLAATATLPLSRRLVTLVDDIPVTLSREGVRIGPPHVEELRVLFTELGLTRQLGLLPKRAAPVVEAAVVDAPEPAPFAWRYAGATEAAAFIERDKMLAFVPVVVGGAGESGLVGLAVAADGEALYVPVAHRVLGAPAKLSPEETSAVLAACAGRTARSFVWDRAAMDSLIEVRANCTFLDVQLLAYVADPDAPRTWDGLANRVQIALPEAPGGKKKGAPDDVDLQPVDAVAEDAIAKARVLLAAGAMLAGRVVETGLETLLVEVDLPLRAVLTRMECRGVGIDVEELGRQATSVRAALVEIEARAQRIVGRPISMRSRTQLEAVFFDELGLPVIKKTPKGGRSVDAEVLEELASRHEFPRVVLEHRELDKLLGTYLDTLPTFVRPATGRIHPRFDQTNAVTGRLACHDPNLQNVPIRTEMGRRVRDAFVARPGKWILSADYSQIELRVLAHLSGDRALINAFASGVDIHRATAARMYGLSLEDVSQDQRRSAKAINFGVLYGMGEWALGKQLGVGRDEAARFISSYFAAYPDVSGWLDGVIARARETGFVRTLDGRVRYLPNLSSTNRVLRTEAERMAKNTPIQGTAADILKRAMTALEACPARGAEMVLTVHDELVFEVDEGLVEEAAAHVKTLMENVVALNVRLVVDAGYGANWGLAHR